MPTKWCIGLDAATFQLPPPPAWVAGVPFFGERIAELWQQATDEGFAEVAKIAKPYVNAAVSWLAGRAGSVGAILLQIFATVIIAAVMYAYGESAAAGLRAFGRRLAGAARRGHGDARRARQCAGVALGVVVAGG